MSTVVENAVDDQPRCGTCGAVLDTGFIAVWLGIIAGPCSLGTFLTDEQARAIADALLTSCEEVAP